MICETLGITLYKCEKEREFSSEYGHKGYEMKGLY